jgi:hypothetical protein
MRRILQSSIVIAAMLAPGCYGQLVGKARASLGLAAAVFVPASSIGAMRKLPICSLLEIGRT